MKPFCSGGTGDVDLLFALQEGALLREELNPFWFPDPIAPLMAARNQAQTITMEAAIASIERLSSRCETLIVEGAGGLLAPLGECRAQQRNSKMNRHYNLLDLACAARGQFIVAAMNKIGVINHTLLTLGAIARQFRAPRVLNACVALMHCSKPDPSTRSNAMVLAECLPDSTICPIPSLPGIQHLEDIRNHAKNLQSSLEALLIG